MTTTAMGPMTKTTTTSTFGSRTKPMTSKEAADYLNKLYLGFDKDDTTTKVGVTVSMAANVSSFFGNIYCSKFFNPGFNGYTSCFKGQADCRMSTSTISKNWMTNKDSKAFAGFAGRAAGYVFNQTMVETKWTKCSYIWDGASFNLLNRGCGDGTTSNACGPTENNAFNNKCGPKLDHTCTAADDEVKRKICDVAGGSAPVPKKHDSEPECMFPGPAFDFHGQDDFKPGKDYTRVMAEQRMLNNDGSDNEGPNIEKNNEVVLDEELLIPDIWKDPTMAITGIVYSKKTNQGGLNKKYAMQLQTDVCKHLGCDENGGGMIPLVMVDDVDYQENGPFFDDSAGEVASIAI
jgi:hypothetical protein